MMTRLMVLAAAVLLTLSLAGTATAQVSDSCDAMMPGDANSDGGVNVGDCIFMIHYYLEDGPAPDPLANGDYNGDCVVDSNDVHSMLDYMFKCKGVDKCSYAPVQCTCQEPEIGEFYHDISFGSAPGDVNADGYIHIGDVVYLVAYIFRDGPEPEWYAPIRGDANCDCETNVADAIYIVNYVFRSGPAPCSSAELINTCDIDKDVMIIQWMMQN